MRSVEVGGRRDTQRVMERCRKEKKIYYLSRISPSALFFVLVHFFVDATGCMLLCGWCSYCFEKQTKKTTIF